MHYVGGHPKRYDPKDDLVFFAKTNPIFWLSKCDPSSRLTIHRSDARGVR